jgi:transposase
MQVVYPRCCGLDVHKTSVVACVLLTQPDGTVERHVRTFGTMTADLLALDDWLEQWQISHVALESTGVYWRPVYNLLEAQRIILLVNPKHMKAVPGRKTDVKDSEWIADLLRHGLLQASFIPPQPIRELRELTRYRKTLVEQRAAEANRLQKLLEGANIKLAAVATDVLGKSGRDMLVALIEGTADAATMAELARGRLRAKLPQLREALEGRVQPVHRFLLRQFLALIEFLEDAIAEVQAEIERHLVPYKEAEQRLQTIPGVGATAAAAIIAEIGVDMSRFASARHLAAWAGVCPGNRESGGKRLKEKARQGNVALRAILCEVTCSLERSKNNYLSAQFQRLARRLGKPKARIAVAHSILTIIYHLLKDGTAYHDLGADYFDKLDRERIERHHIRRLEQLGYTVTLTTKQAAA